MIFVRSLLFYAKIYAHRLVECTIRPIPQHGIMSMLSGIQSYSSFFYKNICACDIIMLLGKVEL